MYIRNNNKIITRFILNKTLADISVFELIHNNENLIKKIPIASLIILFKVILADISMCVLILFISINLFIIIIDITQQDINLISGSAMFRNNKI